MRIAILYTIVAVLMPVAGDTHDRRGLPQPRQGFRWRREAWGWSLECEDLASLARHGWTTRDLRLEGPDDACGPQWDLVAGAAGLPPSALRRLTQVHGSDVLTGDVVPGSRADGLATTFSDIGLTVRVADCVPLLVADRHRRVVAAIHAGWRGTRAGIARRAVESVVEQYGVAPADLVAAGARRIWKPGSCAQTG
jgi:Multi-copper polyphenol oxidoreductase laccase